MALKRQNLEDTIANLLDMHYRSLSNLITDSFGALSQMCTAVREKRMLIAISSERKPNGRPAAYPILTTRMDDKSPAIMTDLVGEGCLSSQAMDSTTAEDNGDGATTEQSCGSGVRRQPSVERLILGEACSVEGCSGTPERKCSALEQRQMKLEIPGRAASKERKKLMQYSPHLCDVLDGNACLAAHVYLAATSGPSCPGFLDDILPPDCCGDFELEMLLDVTMQPDTTVLGVQLMPLRGLRVALASWRFELPRWDLKKSAWKCRPLTFHLRLRMLERSGVG